MRKATWLIIATFALLSTGSGAFLVLQRAMAADSVVEMAGTSSDYTSWKFKPAEITVPAGTTVVWRNTGQVQHTATADGMFDSKLVDPGGEFKFTVQSPGDIHYYCQPHKDLGMTGIIHVTGGTATTVPGVTTTKPATATTATTAPAAGATTTTAKPGASSTTTTTAAGAAGATTTTTAAAAGGTTATTAAAPTATDTASTTTTTAAGAGGGESAAGTHRKSHSGKTNGPLVALAAVLTVALVGISGKLLATKSRPH